MNPPVKSKINYTALITQIITIFLLFGFIPVKFTQPILVIVGILLPGVIQAWRTWYTEK